MVTASGLHLGCTCEPAGGDDGVDPGTDGGGTSAPAGSDASGDPSDATDPNPGTSGATSTGGDDGGNVFDCPSIANVAPTEPVELAAACAAVPIINPSFEVPVIDSDWVRYDSDGSDAGIPGWVGSVDLHRSSDLSVAPDGGVQIVDLNQNGPGSIEQAISLVEGQAYRLSFYHGVNHHCVTSASVRVEVGGRQREFQSSTTITRSTFDFTAAEADTVVRFTSLTEGCGAATIDAVAIDCPAIEPSIVFGQPNATETVPNGVTPNRVFHPQGVVIDRNSAPNRVYVWDSGNGRVLGFAALGTCAGEASPCTHDEECTGGECIVDPTRPADLVFGQRDGASATCNGDNTRRMSASAATLCGQYYPQAISLLESADPNAMAVDELHSLYVVDKWNHRVLRYDDPFGSCDVVADVVYGQTDFTERACNRGEAAPSSSSLCINSETGNSLGGGLLGSGVDAGDGQVWVTDGGNHRVLRFDRDGGAANLVLGQLDAETVDVTNCNPPDLDALDPVHLCRPKALRHDAAADRLYVVDWPDDTDTFRVVIYDGPFTDGMAATESLIGTQDGAVGEHWNRPSGIELDPTDVDAFWLVDSNHSRVLRYVRDAEGWGADKVVSQPDLVQVGPVAVGCPTANSDCLVEAPAGSMGVDSRGGLYLSDLGLQRVMRFAPDVPDADELDGHAIASEATVLAPQPHVELSRPVNRVGAVDLFAPNGVAVAEYGGGVPTQLLVSDQYRVLAWNDPASSATGAPADAVLLQAGFDEMINGTGRALLGLDVDPTGRVFVGVGVEVRVFQGPITTGAAPISTVPNELPLATGGSLSLGSITGIAYDAIEDALWIADSSNHRVVRVASPTSGARQVDLVLGQASLDSTEANRGVDVTAENACPTVVADGFGNLGMIEFDRHGDLYIVDGTHEGWQCSNNRIVAYDRADLVPVEGTVFFADGARTATRVYGATSFTVRGGSGDPDAMDLPIGVAFDAANRMVVTADGYGNPANRRVFLYGNPAPGCSDCAVDADAIVPLTVSQASDAAWDAAGNLLVLDQTWARVLLVSAADLAAMLPSAG